MARLGGDIEVVFSAADEFSGTLNKFRSEMGSAASEAERHWTAVQGAWLKVSAAIATAAYAAKKAWDFAAIAAQFEEQKIALDGLAKQYGTSSAVMIASIQRAAEGTIAQVDAIGVANKALIMGLDPAQLEFFTMAAKRLSGAIGGDTASAFERLTEVVATGQQRQLRALGIIVDLEAEYKKYGTELSAAEKQTANFEIVSRSLNETFARMGPDIDTAADKMERLTAKMKDLKKGMGDIVLSAAGAVHDLFYPAGLASAFAQAESDSKNLYKNLDELKRRAKELAAEGLSIEPAGDGDRSEMMRRAAFLTRADELYRESLYETQDRTQMMNLAISLSEQEKSRAMIDGMNQVTARAAEFTDYLRSLSEERQLFSEEELYAIQTQDQQHEWMVQSRAAIHGVAYQAMEQQMLRLVEAGRFSAGEMAKAIMQQVKMELVGIASRATIWAIYETAAGIAASSGPWGLSTFGNPAAHFKAAATFAATAAAALAGSAVVNALTGPGAQRPEAGTAGGYPIQTTDTNAPTALTSSQEQQVTQHITLNVQSLDPSSVNWAKIIEEDVAPALEALSGRGVVLNIQTTQK